MAFGVTGTRAGSSGAMARLRSRTARYDSPVTSYYLLLGATTLLVVIGLVMVLSSSSVEAYKSDGSSYAVFLRQAAFAGVGAPLMWIASRLSVATWKRLAWPLFALTVVGQALVFSPLGVAVSGNRNWIEIAGMRAQPSEAAKLALVIWCAAVLARKARLLDQWAHVLIPVAPGAGLVVGLVLLGRDLGTGLVLITLVGGMLFAAGAPARVFVLAGSAAVVAVGALVVTSQNRMNRVQSWLGLGDPSKDQYFSEAWQSTHGLWALASGGWWGVGLGASREKWSWLPEAHNDFIFAIIGEELGLPGTLAVIGLFAALGIGFLRVARRHDDLFVTIATAGVMTWVLGQAVINIGAVIGMLPVIGVPLPLISSGGSALVMTMVALGMVLSFARQEPGAAQVLQARSGVVRRSLTVVPGRRGRAGP